MAADEGLVDVAEEGAGRGLALEVGGEVRVVGLQLVGVFVVEVAALGDGHGDDVGVRVGHLGDDGLAVAGGEDVVGDAADDVGLVSLGAALEACV